MEIHDVVRRRAARAPDWLTGLPALVAALEQEWSMSVGRPFMGGSEAYVAEATLADGTPAVLKLLIPHSEAIARHEITALRLANGEGCARVLRADEARGAVLLERLGPTLHSLGLPLERRLEILVDVARAVWRPAAGSGLPTGADKGRWLDDYIARTWAQLGRPCAARTVEHARACLARRIAAHDDGRAVLVHGDVHALNTLRAGGGFKLVDPDGLLAEPEYDLGVLMRDDVAELLRDGPHARARWLAARARLDPAAIWQWGVAERVSTGLALASLEMLAPASEMLGAADHIAEHCPELVD